MKVLTVSYRETRTFWNYQNVCVEMSAEVGADDRWQNVFEVAKTNVQIQLAKRVEERERERERESTARYEVSAKTHELQRIEDDIAEAKQRWERAKEFLAKHGISEVDDIPF